MHPQPSQLKIKFFYFMVGVSDEELLLTTEFGKVIRIKTDLVRPLGRATQGVKIINLEDNDRVVSMARATATT